MVAAPVFHLIFFLTFSRFFMKGNFAGEAASLSLEYLFYWCGPVSVSPHVPLSILRV